MFYILHKQIYHSKEHKRAAVVCCGVNRWSRGAGVCSRIGKLRGLQELTEHFKFCTILALVKIPSQICVYFLFSGKHFVKDDLK